MTDPLYEQQRQLRADVIKRADVLRDVDKVTRGLAEPHVHYVRRAADELCDGWEWTTKEMVGRRDRCDFALLRRL